MKAPTAMPAATQSQTATANQTAQSDRLQEAQSRQASNSGVNLDEELSNMMIYQQAYSAGARISLPLGTISARNNFRSSKAAQTQAVLTVKRLEQSIMIQIDTAMKQAQSNFERVDATKKARQFAEDALDAETRKFQAGKSTGFEVLRLQRDLTTARGNEIQALATYNKALSQLSLYEGSTLQRRGIDLTLK